jgi:hypothetical protein
MGTSCRSLLFESEAEGLSTRKSEYRGSIFGTRLADGHESPLALSRNAIHLYGGPYTLQGV